VGFFHDKEFLMQSINIDGTDYDAAKLSPEALAQLGSIRFVDQELERLQAQVAVLQTARLAYAKALKELLPSFVMPN
jgi:hypothetical protein